MSKRKRRHLSAEFKARIATEALKEEKSIQPQNRALNSPKNLLYNGVLNCRPYHNKATDWQNMRCAVRASLLVLFFRVSMKIASQLKNKSPTKRKQTGLVKHPEYGNWVFAEDL